MAHGAKKPSHNGSNCFYYVFFALHARNSVESNSAIQNASRTKDKCIQTRKSEDNKNTFFMSSEFSISHEKKICFLSQTKQGSESPRPRVSSTIISFGVFRAVMNGARTRANLSCYDMSAALTIISKLENQHMAGVFVQLRLFDFSLSISKTTYIHTPSMRLLPFCIDLEMSL